MIYVLRGLPWSSPLEILGTKQEARVEDSARENLSFRARKGQQNLPKLREKR